MFIFLLGFISSITQTIIFRELSVLLSSNEIIISILLFFWLIGNSIGSNIFRNIENKILNNNYFKNSINNNYFIFNYFNIIYLVNFSILILIRLCWRFFQFNSNPDLYKIIFFNFIFIFPYSILLGFSFQLLTFFDYNPNTNKSYYLDSLGYLFGGIIITLLFIIKFDSYQVLIFISIITNIIIYLKIFRLDINKNLIFIILSLFLFIFQNNITNFLYKIQWNKSNIIKIINSKYGNIAFINNQEQILIYYQGKLIDNISIDYNKEDYSHIPAILTDKPYKILILGIPNFSLIKNLIAFYNPEIYVINIDPELNNLYKNIFSNYDKIYFIDNDPEVFINNIKHFDLIYLNFSFPEMINQVKYFDYKFYKKIYNYANMSNIICTSLNYDENNINLENFYNILLLQHLISNIFTNFISFPLDEYLIVFSKSKINYNLETLLSKLDKISLKKLNRFYINSFLYESRIKKINYLIDKYKIKNISNISYDIYFNQLKKWLKINANTSYYFIFNIIIIILLFLLNKNIFPKLIKFNRIKKLFNIDFNNFNNIYIIFNSFILIINELILLNYFQIKFGYIYEYYGILISIFMFGLCLGSGLIYKNITKNYTFYQIMLILLSFIIFFTINFNLEIDFIILILIFTLLFFNGLLGSSILNLIIKNNKTKMKNSELIAEFYSSDLIGGAFGSILSIFLILFIYRNKLLYLIILILLVINNFYFIIYTKKQNAYK